MQDIRCVYGGDIAGAICVLDSSPKIFSPEQMSLLMDLAAIVEDEFELLQIAIKDSLTEQFNSRSYTLFLEKTFRKARLKRACLVSSLLISMSSNLSMTPLDTMKAIEC
jgi:GGDEF domain-containing protein